MARVTGYGSCVTVNRMQNREKAPRRFEETGCPGNSIGAISSSTETASPSCRKVTMNACRVGTRDRGASALWTRREGGATAARLYFARLQSIKVL